MSNTALNIQGKISSSEVTSGSLIIKNTLWNTLGFILPLIVGFFAIPLLIHGLGTERFGVLTIVWMVIGYSSIFDFGLGRALTKLVAEKLGDENYDEIPGLIWTALLLIAVLSVLSTIIVFFLADTIVFKWLNISPNLQAETLTAFKILAFSIPLVVVSTGFRSILEAYQKFAIINVIRIPLALITFLGPFLTLPFSVSLDKIVIVIFVGRVVGAYAFYHFMVETVPVIKRGVVISKQQIRNLITYGSWMTVDNLVAPLIIYIDRFIIGSVLTMAAVTLYVAPYEIVNRLSTLAVPFVGVLFPAFSTLMNSDKKKVAYFYTKGNYLVFFLVFPLVLIIVAIAPEAVAMWLGKDFGETSALVLQCLAIGVLINSAGQIPFVLLQGAGRPDIPAKLYILELPFYVIAILFAINHFGIAGVAVVWSLRVAVDTFVFLIAAVKLIPETKAGSIKIALKLSAATAILSALILINSFPMRIAGLLILLPVYLAAEWKYGIAAEDRAKIISLTQLRKRFV